MPLTTVGVLAWLILLSVFAQLPPVQLPTSYCTPAPGSIKANRLRPDYICERLFYFFHRTQTHKLGKFRINFYCVVACTSGITAGVLAMWLHAATRRRMTGADAE